MPASLSPAKVASRIEQALKRHANPERVEVFSAGYAPSGLRYIGTSNPDMRGVMRTFARELKAASPRAIIEVALALVARGTMEGRQVGYELIARRKDAMALLTPALIRKLGRGNDNWASVDGFSCFVAGPAWGQGLLRDKDAMGWARSGDRWWRRTALASTVALNLPSRGGHGDVNRTLAICRVFARETDPMLAKALSWALRSIVQYDKAAVTRFVATHAATLPAIVKREVGTKIRTGKKSG